MVATIQPQVWRQRSLPEVCNPGMVLICGACRIACGLLIGLLVQLKSKVPNWGFPARYPTDFVRRALRDGWGKFTAENSNEISLSVLKTGLSASNVRGGPLVVKIFGIAP